MFYQRIKTISFKAFSLLEISLSLMIIGISTISTFGFLKIFRTQQAVKITKENQLIIMHAVGRFVNQFGYVPKPAKPEHHHCGLSNSISNIGVVPWITLNIPYEAIFDGNGHLITYAVHPGFAQNSTENQVHNNHKLLKSFEYNANSKECDICLKSFKIPPSNPLTLYAQGQKVDFSQDIIIYHKAKRFERNKSHNNIDSNSGYIPTINNIHHSIHNSESGTATTSTIASIENYIESLPAVSNCPIVLLISHGTTGGHYDLNGKRTEIKCECKEAIENAQDTNVFHLNTKNLEVTNLGATNKKEKFDHIILYSTRFDLEWYGGPKCYPIALDIYTYKPDYKRDEILHILGKHIRHTLFWRQ